MQATVARLRSQWGPASGQKFTASGLSFPLLLIGRSISLKAAFWCYYILTLVPLVTVCGNNLSNSVQKASNGLLTSEASVPRFSRPESSMREPRHKVLIIYLKLRHSFA
jgi:hypothetical protein